MQNSWRRVFPSITWCIHAQYSGNRLFACNKQLDNNLKLYRAKTVEVIFTVSGRNLQPYHPPELLDICHATSIRMLVVTLTNHLSVSGHIRDVISRCAKSLNALKIMCCHVLQSDLYLMRLQSPSPSPMPVTVVTDAGDGDTVRKHSSQSSTCSSPPPAKPNSPDLADMTVLWLLSLMPETLLRDSCLKTCRSISLRKLIFLKLIYPHIVHCFILSTFQ